MTPFLLTLCKHSLLAAAVLALAAITKPLWRERYGARSRCALWLALAVFLLLPVDWSAPNAPVRVEPPAERTLLLSAQRGPSVVRTDELPRRQETVLSGAENTSPLPADPSVTFEDAYGTAPDNSAKNVPLTGLLFLLWASGMTGYTTLQIVKYKKFYRLVRRWRHETTRSDYARLLADECAALGVKRPQLLLCEAVGTPMMTGLFHPVLLLPHEDYEPAALRFILRHELCHLKRHDLAYKLVLTAANAVHWFDPLVYWMLRQADEDVELACDSRATEGMTHAERTAYGETLLAAVQAKIAPVPMTTSFGSTAERLKRRLANVLGGKKRRGLWLAALAIAAVAASALLIAWQSGTDEKTKDADVWLTMEDYALDRANAVRENGVALFPQPPGGAAVAAVSDVRATELERAAVLDGVFPELDGRPELWCYDYAVRFADEESLSLADQGNWYSIGDGWYDNRQYDVLVVLANADGYRILYTGTWGMVKDYINDSGRTYYREALYDWCADHLALDETDYPRYLHRVTLTYTDGTGSAVRKMAAFHRYEGDGWSVYVPTDWIFTPQWMQWKPLSSVDTDGSTYFEVTRADGNMEDIKAYYASIGAWRFETDLSAPLDYYYNVGGGYDAAYGYAHEELYFVPIDGDHCYVLSCYSVNGVTSAEDKALLRAALTSFTPDESLRWTTEQRFQYEIDCLEHGTGVELTLLSGARELGSCRNDFAISGGLCPLGQYTYTPWEDAVYAGGDKAIRLTVSDGCYLEVYEDSNLISYCRSDGSLLGRYMASGAGLGDGSIVPVEGTSLYGVVREWYDMLELADVRRAPVIFIADEGQSWQEAAQSWADAYWNALTRVPEDNVYHCGFVRAKAYSFLSDDDNEQMRRLGKLREGEYGFYMNGYFVPTHAEELTARYDEHDMQPVEAGDGLPAGTYTTFYRCMLIAADGGWYGEILGNGSW